MNNEYAVIFTLAFTFMMFIVQRSEKKYRRRVFWLFFLFIVPMLAYLAYLRQAGGQFMNGILIAFVINFLFWALIGRYNPVGSSDDNIRVLKMDD